MPLPTPLLRKNFNHHKNKFGHALIIAGSNSMLGAAALSGLSTLRSGAGLVSICCAKSLNNTLQKKINHGIMTIPVKETSEKTIASEAFGPLKNKLDSFNAIAIGPGLSQNKSTVSFVKKIVEHSNIPLVIDADAINAIAKNPKILVNTKTPKILTPHIKEFSRLVGISVDKINLNKVSIAKKFANTYQVSLILKGKDSLIVFPKTRVVKNTTGNVGMATAGSGDVLTGMLTAFLAQGIETKKAAKLACHLHGLAGDLAACDKTKVSLIATDIIDYIPKAIKSYK